MPLLAATPAILGGLSVGAAAVGTLFVASTLDQYNRANKAEKKQEELSKFEKAKATDSAVRERRNQIRQQRVAAARIENTATQTGQQSSTAANYGIGGVQTQVNSNIGQINTALAFGSATSKLQQDIFNLQQPSGVQYASQLAGSIFETPKIKVK